MNKHFLAGGVALAVALSLGACGGGGSKTPEAAPGDTIASQMIMGGPAEFKTREAGLIGLKDKYDVEFGQFKVTDTGGPVTVNALKNGQIDAANLFSTDPAIPSNDFVVLEDPESVFAAQNVVPIINTEKASDGVKETLNEVSAKLTSEGLIDLVDQAVNDKEDAADVAAGWLADNGLDGTGSAAAGESLTVGSANFPENVILAEIYAQVLEAQGAQITKKLNIGSREKYFPALEQGSLDLFPEYSGNSLLFIDKDATATSPEDVYAALTEALPENLEALEMSDAQDTDAVVVTSETAEEFGLTTIADLAKPLE
jgi:glycine betaine/choline ABC-type transport system substrate-binding protein